ncbi:MAG: RNA polymerase sigma factor [Planctomycetes bacterium]|nr:RNA polymerase sigma factor [Planctomycetota bacterium]
MGTAEQQQIARAIAGDHGALGDLLGRFGGQVAGLIEGQIGAQWRSVLDVDDVMQVTYLEAFLHIDRLAKADERTFLAWLRRIAENNLRDALRGLQCEKRPPPHRRLRPPPECDTSLDLLELIGASTTSVGREVGRGEVGHLLEGALRRLPVDYAAVLRLYDLDGLSAPEVAREIGRSRGAVHMLRARALVRLRELLGSESKFFSDAP